MWGESLVRDSLQLGDYSRGLSDKVDIKIINKTDIIDPQFYGPECTWTSSTRIGRLSDVGTRTKGGKC